MADKQPESSNQNPVTSITKNAIEIKSLEFHYPRGDFSLRIPKLNIADAETIAVIGPSGTGKTTLLNLVAAYNTPHEGTVTIGDKVVSSLDDTAILRRYGLVPGNMSIPEDNPLYEKGTLLIYAFDSKTGDVIWRSAVQAAVDFSLDKEERKARIEPIIRDMSRTMPSS